jgi:hypothetical protein
MEVLTSSPLACKRESFFQNEILASDGAFEGYGCLKCSYKHSSNDEVKGLFNLALCELRTGTDVPSLGSDICKRLSLEEVPFLAIHAAIRLHNFAICNYDYNLVV